VNLSIDMRKKQPNLHNIALIMLLYEKFQYVIVTLIIFAYSLLIPAR
jgi:hypothetical protein